MLALLASDFRIGQGALASIFVQHTDVLFRRAVRGIPLTLLFGDAQTAVGPKDQMRMPTRKTALQVSSASDTLLQEAEDQDTLRRKYESHRSCQAASHASAAQHHRRLARLIMSFCSHLRQRCSSSATGIWRCGASLERGRRIENARAHICDEALAGHTFAATSPELSSRVSGSPISLSFLPDVGVCARRAASTAYRAIAVKAFECIC